MKSRGAMLWIVIIAASFFLLGVLADRSLFDGDRAARPTYLERLTRDLGLTDEQKNAIAGFLEEEDEAVKRILDSHREPIRLAIQEVRDSTRLRIHGVLEDSQREIFDRGGLFSK